MTSVESSQCMTYPPVCKRDENVDQEKKLTLRNRRITVHEVANMFVTCEAKEKIPAPSLNKPLS
jgi:hypothetical protein